MAGTVLIFSGGDPLAPHQVGALPAGVTVVAADSGIDRAHQAGFAVNVAVGDFDSVSAAGLSRASSDGADIRRHPVAKDQTDLELAIHAALELDPERIVFVAMSGGRPDHEHGGLALLANQRLAGAQVDAVLAGAKLSVVFNRRALAAEPGDLVSLLAVGGDAQGVTTTGLCYPLTNEELLAASGRGVSNVFEEPEAVVSVRSGVLFAYQPDSSYQRESTE